MAYKNLETGRKDSTFEENEKDKPELLKIEIEPSDEPQANIKPQSGEAQDIAFTKTRLNDISKEKNAAIVSYNCLTF